MISARERNNPAVLLGKRLLLVAIVAAAILMVPGVWKVYQKERESRLLKAEATQELAELRGRERILREKTEALDTPYGLETALREQYSLAREGEKLIVIVNRAEGEPAAAEPPNLMEWFERILKW